MEVMCEKILGVRWENFVRVIGEDDNYYHNPSLNAIAEAMVGERERESLTAIEKVEFDALCGNVADIERRVEIHEKRVLRWRLKGELARAELKFRRKGTPYVVR